LDEVFDCLLLLELLSVELLLTSLLDLDDDVALSTAVSVLATSSLSLRRVDDVAFVVVAPDDAATGSG